MEKLNITPEQIEQAQHILGDMAIPAIDLGKSAFDIFTQKVQVEAFAWLIIIIGTASVNMFLLYSMYNLFNDLRLKKAEDSESYEIFSWQEFQKFWLMTFCIIGFIGLTYFEGRYIIMQFPEILGNLIVPEARVIIEAANYIK